MHVTCIIVIILVACINIAGGRPIITMFSSMCNGRSIMHSSGGKEYCTAFL